MCKQDSKSSCSAETLPLTLRRVSAGIAHLRPEIPSILGMSRAQILIISDSSLLSAEKPVWFLCFEDHASVLTRQYFNVDMETPFLLKENWFADSPKSILFKTHLQYLGNFRYLRVLTIDPCHIATLTKFIIIRLDPVLGKLHTALRACSTQDTSMPTCRGHLMELGPPLCDRSEMAPDSRWTQLLPKQTEEPLPELPSLSSLKIY